MNHFDAIGNLTKDPEYRENGESKSCTFHIAVSRPFKNKEGKYDADFFRVVTFDKRAETCRRFLSKGKKVAVSGSIRTGSYDAQDGTKRYTFDIVADNVEFLTPKSAPDASEAQVNDIGDCALIEDDDLPF